MKHRIWLLLGLCGCARNAVPEAALVPATDSRHILGTYLSARQRVSPGPVHLQLCPGTFSAQESASITSANLGVSSVTEQAGCPERRGAGTFSPGTLLIRSIRQSSDTMFVIAELFRDTHPKSWTEQFIWAAYPTPGEWLLSFSEFAPVH